MLFLKNCQPMRRQYRSRSKDTKFQYYLIKASVFKKNKDLLLMFKSITSPLTNKVLLSKRNTLILRTKEDFDDSRIKNVSCSDDF